VELRVWGRGGSLRHRGNAIGEVSPKKKRKKDWLREKYQKADSAHLASSRKKEYLIVKASLDTKRPESR